MLHALSPLHAHRPGHEAEWPCQSSAKLTMTRIPTQPRASSDEHTSRWSQSMAAACTSPTSNTVLIQLVQAPEPEHLRTRLRSHEVCRGSARCQAFLDC